MGKATQGMGYKDPTFEAHTRMAQDAGFKVGAYHFGTAGDGAAQADHLIEVAGEGTLLVLDYEDNPQGGDMSLQEAEQFVSRIHAVTGRYPGLYSGTRLKKRCLLPVSVVRNRLCCQSVGSG